MWPGPRAGAVLPIVLLCISDIVGLHKKSTCVIEQHLIIEQKKGDAVVEEVQIAELKYELITWLQLASLYNFMIIEEGKILDYGNGICKDIHNGISLENYTPKHT